MRDRREERREYENNVFYEVWRSGGDPDRINYDRVEEHFYNGDYCESAARHEMKMQQPRQEEQYPEEYYQEQCQEEG